jgi:crossover junction endodeoxyribonuclease RuvC
MDPGILNFGWAIINTKKKSNVSGKIITDALFEPRQRIAHILEDISKIVAEYEPEVVAIEKMIIRQVAPSLLEGYAARMAVLAYLSPMDIEFHEYHPATTKKNLLGGGQCTKKEMIDMMRDMFGITRKLSEHEADSFAQIKMYLLEEEKDEDEEEIDVVDFRSGSYGKLLRKNNKKCCNSAAKCNKGRSKTGSKTSARRNNRTKS